MLNFSAMKKILLGQVLIACCMVIGRESFPQPEKFDIINYTPPEGWQKGRNRVLCRIQ